ncbi:MAG: DsbA family protein [Deltaproteobacteria bacterium]|nr:DsbA family protein [Deltaproteobacteria bacterium]
MRKTTPLILLLIVAALIGSFFYSRARNRALTEELEKLQQEITALKTSSAKTENLLAAINKRLNPPPKTTWIGIDDDPMLGKKDAPVTIIEFSEFQCPYCARFALNTFPEIRKKYIDTGKVRFVFRNYPLAFHKNAAKAAEAGACAAEQGMFWNLHDILFQHHDTLTQENLNRYGKEAGLFMDDYLFCMESGKHTVEIQKDIRDGKRAGVTGTPSFFIGVTRKDGRIKGTILRGSEPFAAFRSLIEEKLQEAASMMVS